jgi:hypothetical protein
MRDPTVATAGRVLSNGKGPLHVIVGEKRLNHTKWANKKKLFRRDFRFSWQQVQ